MAKPTYRVRGLQIILVTLLVGASIFAPLPRARHAGATQGSPHAGAAHVAAADAARIAESMTQFPPPPMLASAAALMDADSGRWLYLHDADQRLPMASTTKIMTALLALEHGHLASLVTVGHDAATIGQTTMGLREGERVSLHDLLYGLLLPSGNDAGIAIADYLAGSQARFVTMMNAKAAALHLSNTHFLNSYGFFNTPDGDSPRHYTTARDLATLARYAMRYPLFRQIVATRTYTIPATRTHHTYRLSSINYVIYWYPGADGVKPGWTSGAGICQVVDVHRDGHHLIAVLLHTPNLYTDVRDLLNYGLQDFTWVPSQWPAQDTIYQAVRGTDAQGALLYFPFTGHAVRAPFLTLFERSGGANVFGFPRTELISTASGAEQFFTNLVVTYSAHTGAITPIHLGSAAVPRQQWLQRVKAVATTSWRTYYPQTGHTITYRFRLFYLANGGPAVFGYPVTEKLFEGSTLVQYFENAEFIWHPTSASDGYITLAPLGQRQLARAIAPAAPVTPRLEAAAPTWTAVPTGTPTHIGTVAAPSASATMTPTPSATLSATPSRTPTATRSRTPTATPSPTHTGTVTAVPPTATTTPTSATGATDTPVPPIPGATG